MLVVICVHVLVCLCVIREIQQGVCGEQAAFSLITHVSLCLSVWLSLFDWAVSELSARQNTASVCCCFMLRL